MQAHTHMEISHALPVQPNANVADRSTGQPAGHSYSHSIHGDSVKLSLHCIQLSLLLAYPYVLHLIERELILEKLYVILWLELGDDDHVEVVVYAWHLVLRWNDQRLCPLDCPPIVLETYHHAIGRHHAITPSRHHAIGHTTCDQTSATIRGER